MMTQEERDAQDAIARQAYINALPAKLAEYRYQKETGGITYNGIVTFGGDGITIPTDRDSRANMTGAYIKAKDNPDYTVDWKLPSGFVPLTASEIIAIADAVEAHVKDCFTAEAQVLQNIDNYTTIEEVKEAFDNAVS